MNDKISIIIPAYNVELYLEECLTSIINQTYTNLEIIVVDDGSTDGTAKIIEKFANKDKRISIITEPNGGASMARNSGIQLAKGKYILFVDSDDILENNAIDVFYKTAITQQSDIVIGNALNYLQNGNKIKYFYRNKELNNITIEGKRCFVELMKNNSFFPMVYLYFINREFLLNNQLYFEEGIIYEDELWSLKSVLSANNISLIDSYHYLYRQRKGSIMDSTRIEHRLISYLVIAKNMHQFILDSLDEIKEKEIVGYAYIKIFRLFHDLMSLQGSSEITHAYITYFSDLLIIIYPKLSYHHQKVCLNWYRSAMIKIQI